MYTCEGSNISKLKSFKIRFYLNFVKLGFVEKLQGKTSKERKIGKFVNFL